MEQKPQSFDRQFNSKATQMMKDRDAKLDPARKLAELQQGIYSPDKTQELLNKERVENTEIKKRNFGPLQGLFDFFSGEWSRKKTAEAKKKKAVTEEQNTDTIQPNRFEGLSIQDMIAPRDLEIDFNKVQIGDKFYRTFFVSNYPRFVGPNWLSPLINFEYSVKISTFYYPVDSKMILEKLKRKIGEMEATLYSQMEGRKVVDPSIKVALTDAQQLQDSIAEGTEKFFHFAMYLTISANSIEMLDKISKNVVSTLAAMSVSAKQATLQQETGFISTQPLGIDKLYITRNMDTTSLATTFPFVTSELTMDHGIMYGINQHNKSLVIFDRFDMENANTVVFAKAGAGKSYFVKLEAVRSLMLGTHIIIIDPDKEYEPLCKAVNGAYISFSQDKGDKINPFELSGLGDPDDDELRMKMLSLQGFLKLLMGSLSPVETAILDRALILTYREKGITLDPATQKNATFPLLEDLYKVLKGMSEPEARSMASRLERYIIGSGAGIFNEQSTIELTNPFMVFSVRDLQEELRPMAMYLMLDFIWTRVRKDFKRRILIVDEAWYMMQSPDSAKFLYSVAKRARKYYLGLTTITQDVDDFMQNELGRAIISNSSIQFLMKQSTSAVDRIQQVFNLSEGEKNYLLSCDKGQGLFFAGANHVAIQVLSSQNEHELITSDPKDIERQREQAKLGTQEKSIEEMSAVYEPPAIMQPIKDAVDVDERSVIKRALDQRKKDIEQILHEKMDYQQDLANKVNAPMTAASIAGVENMPGLITGAQENSAQPWNNSITNIVSQQRQRLQGNTSHLTPQGVIDGLDRNNTQAVKSEEPT